MSRHQHYWASIKQDRRIPRAIMLVLSILMAIYITDIVSSLNRSSTSTINNSAHSGQPLVIHTLRQYHLFGKYDGKLVNLPSTQLPLTLEGTIVSPNKQASYALVASTDTPSKVYKVGEILPGGATLYQIQNKQIILKYNNQLQSLRLPIHTIAVENNKQQLIIIHYSSR